MATPLHRHQASLESVIDPLAMPLLSPSERTQAVSTFLTIIEHYNSYEISYNLQPERKYKRGTLLKLVYDHAISDLGRDNVLRYFLTSMTPGLEENPGAQPKFSDILVALSNFEGKSALEQKEVVGKAKDLADHLVDSFFLPLRASSAKTPQPTPHLTPVSQRDSEIIVGTPQRLSSLRAECLLRDRHRCVISRRFDAVEAGRRFETSGAAAVDDDGQLLVNEETEDLEVAHIIPHALASSSDDPSQPLNEAKIHTLRILDLFDPGILYRIEGAKIDRSYNALTLSVSLHPRFGRLEVYFEAEPSAEHTYVIKSTRPFQVFQPRLPITRELFLTPTHNIDPPMSRLLAIHRACCLILYISGAGTYIDKVLRDMEKLGVNSDGTTELGSLVSLKIHKLGEQARAFQSTQTFPTHE